MIYSFLPGDVGVPPSIWQWAKQLVSNLNTRDAALGLASAPTGVVVQYVGATAPGGWVLANGASYPVTTYPALAALLGVESGNFNVPNIAGSIVKT
jgi:hypothetical protein